MACLPQNHQVRLLACRPKAFQQLGDHQWFEHGVGLDQDGPVGTHGERRAQHLLTLADADGDSDNSVALPDSFLQRTASSTAISSKGFMLILMLAVSTPEPSALG